MVLTTVLSFRAFFLTFPSDVSLCLFHHFLKPVFFQIKALFQKKDKRETKESKRLNFCK